MPKLIPSVTIFLECQEKYLFILRTKKGNKVDFGRLNGIGGKVERGEHYLDCAIREIGEETGYQLGPSDLQLKAMLHLHDGYADNWLVAVFVGRVDTREIPLGKQNDEGELIWLKRDEVLEAGYELVDDLHYIWPQILENNRLLFFAGKLNDQEKIEQFKLD